MTLKCNWIASGAPNLFLSYSTALNQPLSERNYTACNPPDILNINTIIISLCFIGPLLVTPFFCFPTRTLKLVLSFTCLCKLAVTEYVRSSLYCSSLTLKLLSVSDGFHFSRTGAVALKRLHTGPQLGN